jgi:hypothetical protein
MPPPQTAVGLAGLTDGVMHKRRSAPFIDHDLDLGPLAGSQKALPVGFHATPEQVLRATFDEGPLGPEALDEALCLDKPERLPDGRPRHAALEGQLVDGRRLLADRPLPRLDSASEKGSKLDISGDRTAPKPGVALNLINHLLYLLPTAEILNVRISQQLRTDAVWRGLHAKKAKRLAFFLVSSLERREERKQEVGGVIDQTYIGSTSYEGGRARRGLDLPATPPHRDQGHGNDEGHEARFFNSDISSPASVPEGSRQDRLRHF